MFLSRHHDSKFRAIMWLQHNYVLIVRGIMIVNACYPVRANFLAITITTRIKSGHLFIGSLWWNNTDQVSFYRRRHLFSLVMWQFDFIASDLPNLSLRTHVEDDPLNSVRLINSYRWTVYHSLYLASIWYPMLD